MLLRYRDGPLQWRSLLGRSLTGNGAIPSAGWKLSRKWSSARQGLRLRLRLRANWKRGWRTPRSRVTTIPGLWWGLLRDLMLVIIGTPTKRLRTTYISCRTRTALHDWAIVTGWAVRLIVYCHAYAINII